MGKDGDPGGQATSSKDPKMQAAKVRLLDGTYKEFELHRGSDGEALFALVSADLSIEEREYFSLCFYDNEGTRHWLYNDKKILRQLKGLPWEFCYEVKFYPTVPSSLNDDHARYNLFLQLRNDVCTGRLPATLETHAILGSLVAQAEFGDAKPTPEYEQYLRSTKFAPQMSDQLIEMIAQKHKEHKGLTPSEAENLYLDTCKQQTMYGIFVFNAKDSKNAPVGIGICAHGIYIYKDQIRVNRFPWQGIIKISYRKNQFAIKLKAGEIDKKEATVTYKVADYQAAKRIWKCAVEHHTFFRLIQPDEKPKSSLFRWGSARFRYQGRTQFQTKMASQMFDKPSTVAVQRASNARLTHSLDNVAHPQTASEQVSPLHYADNELGREPMASPAVSYEVSGPNEKRKLDGDKVGAGLPSDDDELVYTPVESPSSAAYYLSERSSAYSPNSNDYPYTQQMRSPAYDSAWKSTAEHDRSSASTAYTSSGGAGRVYYPGTGETFSGTRSLPKDSSVYTKSSQFDTIEKRAEMQPRPIHDTVHVYHPGHYQDLRQHQRQQQAPVDPNLNGVTPVRSLGRDGEMDRHPIRYFVDVHHSGASQIPQIQRIRHPGKEEVGPPVLSTYVFSKKFATPNAPLQRLEPLRELPSHNIRAYSAMYHHGSSHEDDIPNVRLIARVIPRTPSQENLTPERDSAYTSMETSGKKRQHEESPKTSKQTKKKLKKEEKKEIAASKSKESPKKRAEATTFSGVTTRVLSEKQQGSVPEEGKAGYTSTSKTTRESPHKDDRTFKSQVQSFKSEVEGDASRRGFISGGWRHEGEEQTVEKEQVRPESYGLPSTSYGGPLETTSHQRDLEPAPLGEYAKPYHPGQSWKESKTVKTSAVQPGSAEHGDVKRGREEVSTGQFGSESVRNEAIPTFTTRWGKTTVETPEEEQKVRLIALVRRKSEEEEEPEVKKPKKEKDSPGLFGFWKGGRKKSREALAELPPDERPGPSEISRPVGPVDTTSREKDIEKTPIPKVPPPVPYKPSAVSSETSRRTEQQTVVKQTGPVESIDRQKDLEKTPVKVPPPVPYKPSSIVTETPQRTQEETVKTVVRETGPLDTTKPEKDMEKIPIQVPTSVEYKPSKEGTDTTRTTYRTHHLFGRWRHEGEEETVGKDRVRAYGLPTTSYEGPLEHTKRIGDLEPSPLWEHTKAYHPGESWNDPNYGKKPTTPPVASERTKKKAVFHLKSSDKEKEQAATDEDEEHRVRLIARVPHGTREEESYTGKGEEEPKESDKSRRGFLFGRWRHEGDEETVDKARVRPDTYHIRTDPYQGPLETTTRLSELEPKPLWDYAQAYHSGQSWDDGKSRSWGTKETKEAKPSTSTTVVKESTEKKTEKGHPEGKTAKLHLKKSSSAESEEETRKVRLIARVVHRDTSEDETASRSSKDKESSGLFGFFKGGKSKRHDKGEAVEEVHPHAEKYTGPLDTVDRQKDIDKLPFKAPPPVPYKPKSGGAEHEQQAYKPSAHVTETTHRPQLFGRWRHEGDEETIEKDKVQFEKYGLPVGSYSGPLESTSRHSELDQTPLREHAKAYHSGQSWDTTKVTHGKSEPTGTTATTVTESKSVLHKRSPVKEKHSPITNEEEVAKVRLIALVCPADEQRESHLKEVENKLAKAGVTDVPKVREEHRQGHSDEQSPHTSETKARRGFLFGRWRHEGDEETVEKDRVRTETYGLKTTPYTGPLESTTRSSELDPKPLWDYSQAYHSGQSWDTGKTTKTSSAQSASKEEPGIKKAVLHLKPTKEKSTTGIEEEETRRVKLIALVPPKPEVETETSMQSKDKDRESSGGLFGFFKKGKSKQHEVQKERSPTQYLTSEHYAGPLDKTQRQKDIDKIPFKAPATVPYKPATEETSDITQPGHLFGRWRHEGEEEMVDKSKVRPETYVTSTAQYTGPVDSTQRQSELEPTPLPSHAQVYHSGQSWEAGKGTKAVAAQSAPKKQGKSEKERTTERTAVLHLKGADVKEKSSPTSEEETRRYRLIARVRRSDDDELETTKPGKETKTRQEKVSSPGYTKVKESESYEAHIKPQKETKHEMTTSPGYTKVEGESYEAHVGKPKTADTSKGRHPRLFGRWRHEGEEETVEKEHILPGGYVMPTASYEGPLESTSRESELQPAPLKDYAKAYHSGQSWDPIKGAIHDVEVERKKIDEQIGGVDAGSPEKSGTERTTGKTTVVHTKTSEREQKHVPEETEEETRRVRLIARVLPETPEDEVELRKKSKDKEKESSGGLFGFLKGKRKGRETDESYVKVGEADEPHVSTEKYTGPLDKIDPQKDMEKLPLEVTAPVPAPRRTSAEAPRAPDRVQAFGRWRHEGEEETVEKERVNRDKYGLPPTSYQGPLESTTRISELEPAPLRDYAQAYHHGQSWDVGKGTKTPTNTPTEREEGTAKTGILDLKKSPVKERTSPLPAEDEERKVRLIALVRKTSDEERDLAEREKDLGKSSSSKSPKTKLHKEQIAKTSDIVTEKSPKRGHLFGRWRHEGEEETVEKEGVRPESYGTTTEAYSGPLHSTTPQHELEPAPIGDYATVYHPGQSWDDKGKKSPVLTGVKEHIDEESETDRKTREKAVIHLKTPKEEEQTRATSEEETRKIRLIARVPHSRSEEDADVDKDKSSQERGSSSVFSFWKKKEAKQLEPTEAEPQMKVEKYEGPVDKVSPQKDIDKLPFKAPPPVPYKPKLKGERGAHAYEPTSHETETTHHRSQLFGRWRHEGEEETIDKEKVRTDTYNLPSGHYEGPLDSTTRQSELEPTPLGEHARAYHSGQSWSVTKETTPLKKSTDYGKESAAKKKSSRERTPEYDEDVRKVRLIALVRPGEREDLDVKKPKKEQKEQELSRPPRPLKEEGARQQQAAAKSKETSWLPSLFGRSRHEGEEDVVEKGKVRPESYHTSSTAYEGPLETTAPSADLEPTPLRDFSQAYHSGQSWDDKGVKGTKTLEEQQEKSISETSGTVPQVKDYEKSPKDSRKAVLHLKTTGVKPSAPPLEETDDERKVRLIALVRHTNDEDYAEGGRAEEAKKPKKEQESGGLFGFWKSKTKKPEVTTEEYQPSSTKFEGPLDEIDREKDIEKLPFKAPPPVPYKPKSLKKREEEQPGQAAKTPSPDKTRTTSRPPQLFGRWRHEGDEETIDKDKVRSETYGRSAVPYDGPLDETSRQSELEHTPLQEHAHAYHPGQSWNDSRGGKVPSGHEHHPGPTRGVLHLDASPERETEEERKIRLIARVKHEGDDDQEAPGHLDLRPAGLTEHDTHPTRTGAPPPQEQELHLKSSPPEKRPPSLMTDAEEARIARLINRSKDHGITRSSGITRMGSGERSSTERDFGDRAQKESSPIYRSLISGRDPADKGFDTGHTVGERSTAPRLPDPPRREYTGSLVTEGEHSSAYRSPDRIGRDYGTSSDTAYRRPDSAQRDYTASSLTDRDLNLPYRSMVGDVTRESEYPTRHTAVTSTFWKRTITTNSGSNIVESYQSDNRRSPGREPNLVLESSRPSQPMGSYSGRASDMPSDRGPPPAYSDRPDDKDQHPEGAYTSGYGTRARSGSYSLCGKDVPAVIDTTIYDRDSAAAQTPNYGTRPRAGSYSVCGKDEPAMRDDLYDPNGATAETPYYGRRASRDSVDGRRRDSATNDYRLGAYPSSTDTPEFGTRARSGSYSMYGKDEPSIRDTIHQGRRSSRDVATNDYRLAPYPDSGRRPIPGGHIYDYHEPEASGSYTESRGDQSSTMDTSSYRPRAVATESYRIGSDSPSSRERPAEGAAATASPSGSGHLVASSSSTRGRSQGTMQSGDEYVEVRVDRRAEIQLEPAFCLSGAGLREVAENEDGFVFSVTPPPMPSSSERSFFSRIFKSSSKKSKKQKKTDKGVREADSSESSGDSEDEKNQVHIMPVESGDVTLPLYKDPEDKDGKVVRRETNELKYHLKGEGVSPGFDPENPSLASTMAEAERLNQRSPRLEHAERTVTVRAMAPLPLSYEESGQPHTTISTWQESNRLPDEVTTEYDEKGNKITRTLKTSQVKHTVQKQTFQNYVVPTDGQPGVVCVERVREETTPLGTTVAATTNGTNGSAGSPHVVETHSRTVAYEADPHHEAEHDEGLGEFVSCKTLTSGNRTVETYTYKTERNGVIETHVEHRVTIHSDEPIDHDAELTHAIMEATQMNPDMTVEKIEVRQESTA